MSPRATYSTQLVVAATATLLCLATGNNRSRVARAHNPATGSPGITATVMAASRVPHVVWTGQDAEDQYAFDHFFNGVRGGSYLELGAHNGVHLSNTKSLHDFYGWRGVLIEANPVDYALLAESRPYDLTVHAAICASHGTVHYVSNGVVGGIWELMPQSFRERWHPNVDPTKLPLVPCLPLKDVLAVHNVTHINFFSLDVEGAELSVLESMDFGRISFDVIVIEADEHSEAKNTGVRNFLAGKGYKLHERVLRNDWFVRTGFKGVAKS